MKMNQIYSSLFLLLIFRAYHMLAQVSDMHDDSINNKTYYKKQYFLKETKLDLRIKIHIEGKDIYARLFLTFYFFIIQSFIARVFV